jgi:uncharacterized metal-binding protein YceD (DUF177 family)
MSRDPAHPWSVPVAIHEVPLTGRHVELAADTAVRAAVAKSIGLRALPRLEAVFDVTHHGREGLRVVGRVSATVEQQCVVTLEPVENEVEEQVDLTFVPAPPSIVDHDQRASPQAADEGMPEVLVGGMVDLGTIAVEFLTLGIDPYPRRPGVEFTSPASDDESGHPFAALAALKHKAERS